MGNDNQPTSVREVEQCNCPTCDTVGSSGSGEVCWNCQGRGWVSYPRPHPLGDHDPAFLS